MAAKKAFCEKSVKLKLVLEYALKSMTRITKSGSGIELARPI